MLIGECKQIKSKYVPITTLLKRLVDTFTAKTETDYMVFPSEDGKVKGFFGTGDVVFVCQRPSTRGGRIPNKWDLKFYGLLKEYGFGSAHITDLIKCRGLAGKTSARRIRNCFPYLKKEIEILKPRLILAVGGMVYRVSSERISELSPWSKNLEKITHYSYAFRYNKAEKLKKELKDLERKMRIRRK